jgi:prepilin-type N-terminal cleavage/methylation domain-containing protein
MIKGNSQAGFTLIETLVAIGILVVAVVAPLTLATQSLTASLVARDEITAFHLAQEALEWIRNRRDSNWLTPQSWEEGGVDRCGPSAGPGIVGCIVDTKQNSISECTGSCPPLQYDSVTGFYGYGSGYDRTSRFTRTIVTQRVNQDEFLVEVTMSWQTARGTRTFVLRENILNWAQGI